MTAGDHVMLPTLASGGNRCFAMWLSLGLTGALSLTGAKPATAGGQGNGPGVPTPDFVHARDDRDLKDLLTTSLPGAPAPRWVFADEPTVPCVAPELVTSPIFANDNCPPSPPPPDGCHCDPIGPGFYTCGPDVAGTAYEFPLRGSMGSCAGATLRPPCTRGSTHRSAAWRRGYRALAHR